MDIRKNYAFWCNEADVKDVCNRVYDLLDKDIVDAKSNAMIVFKNNDCWFFLDIEFNCIDGLFDASFVNVGCKNRKRLSIIKRSNKKYPVAQKAIYKLDYSDDDKLKKSILMPEYFEDACRKDIIGYGVVKRELAESSNINKYQRSILSRNIGIGCTSEENIDIVKKELIKNLNVDRYSRESIVTTDGSYIRFFQLGNENIRGYKFEEVYIEEGYDNMDFIETCVRPKLIYNPYNIYKLDVNDAAGSIMRPWRFGGRF